MAHVYPTNPLSETVMVWWQTRWNLPQYSTHLCNMMHLKYRLRTVGPFVESSMTAPVCLPQSASLSVIWEIHELFILFVLIFDPLKYVSIKYWLANLWIGHFEINLRNGSSFCNRVRVPRFSCLWWIYFSRHWPWLDMPPTRLLGTVALFDLLIS